MEFALFLVYYIGKIPFWQALLPEFFYGCGETVGIGGERSAGHGSQWKKAADPGRNRLTIPSLSGIMICESAAGNR